MDTMTINLRLDDRDKCRRLGLVTKTFSLFPSRQPRNENDSARISSESWKCKRHQHCCSEKSWINFGSFQLSTKRICYQQHLRHYNSRGTNQMRTRLANRFRARIRQCDSTFASFSLWIFALFRWKFQLASTACLHRHSSVSGGRQSSPLKKTFAINAVVVLIVDSWGLLIGKLSVQQGLTESERKGRS